MTDLPHALDVALDAAWKAGAFLAEHFEEHCAHEGAITVRTKSSPIDMVTELDGQAQRMVIDAIQKHYPDHRFLAEEEGADGIGEPSSPFRWIVDPLDGTMNFIHRKQNFGTIIALEENDEIVVGVMHLPMLGLTFSATRGGGSFVNGKPVKLRATRDMHDAVLCCNMIHRAKAGDDGILRVTAPDCGSLENYGCAADEIGHILLGQNDGAFFRGIPQWDVAAGMLLVAEAGGRSGWVKHTPDDPRSVTTCALSTAPIFDELADFVFRYS